MRLIAELPGGPGWADTPGRCAGRLDWWRRLAKHPAALIALLLAAFWPVWAWYGRRIVDGSDEPLGLGALGVAGGLLWHRARGRGWSRPDAPRQWVALALVAVYAAAFPFAPALVRALLAMAALAVALPPMRGAAGIGGLLLLSLPLVATMQFYLGYPLRVIAAETTRLVLTGFGYGVAREGTALVWAGEAVLVDAPCSGVQMLWAGGVLACILAAVRGLSLPRTTIAGLAAVCVIVAANALRAAALFFKEAGLVALPEWTHSAIGLVAFAAGAMAIGGIVRWLARERGRPSGISCCVVARPGHRSSTVPLAPRGNISGEPPATTGQRPVPPRVCSTSLPYSMLRTSPDAVPCLAVKLWEMLGPGSRKSAGLPRSLAVVCLIAGLVPALMARQSPPHAPRVSGKWPASLGVEALTEIPLGARELRFSADFPGRIARFTDGRRDFIARLASQPTRKLHSSADCFRGLGYTITAQPALLDAQGRNWARFAATHGSCRLLVRERIEAADGTAWTDVSAWFWQSSFDPAKGPWLATTVIENER